MEEVIKYLEEIVQLQPDKIIVSAPENDTEYDRIVLWKKDGYYQAEQFKKTQVFHKNIPYETVMAECTKLIQTMFFHLNAFGNGMEFGIKRTKKGRFLFRKANGATQVKIEPEHNRKKRYIIEEGDMIPPLVDMGIFTKEGKVVNSMYDKFKQINKFVEILDDTIEKAKMTSLHIIDFGCGKSYLTFIVYYYLTNVKKMQISMVGLDLKKEVIDNCNRCALKYGYENLIFEQGDINGYQTIKPVDMVISLHACDTATDYALYNAITWGAKIILSVPCCQHEIASQFNGKDFGILGRYGIVKERTSALLTDAIRCNLLTYLGYRTQLLEFIDLSHTPKNLLIRAVKTNLSNVHRKEARQEVLQAVEVFCLKPTLLELINKKPEE